MFRLRHPKSATLSTRSPYKLPPPKYTMYFPPHRLSIVDGSGWHSIVDTLSNADISIVVPAISCHQTGVSPGRVWGQTQVKQRRPPPISIVYINQLDPTLEPTEFMSTCCLPPCRLPPYCCLHLPHVYIVPSPS